MILNSSVSVCVSASPQFHTSDPFSFPSAAPTMILLLPVRRQIPKSSGKPSLPQIWQWVLREGGKEGWGWGWAEGAPVLPPFAHKGDMAALHCTVESTAYSATWATDRAMHLTLAVWDEWILQFLLLWMAEHGSTNAHFAQQGEEPSGD